MLKVAIVVLTDIVGGEAHGRIVNALHAAKEFRDLGDEVQIIFTGIATKWLGVLSKPNHKLHATYVELKGNVKGVCSYCAIAFGVSDEIEMEGLPLLEEFGRSMSYRNLIMEGFTVLSF